MKLNYITFVFENCDEITIDGKYIGDFLVDDIHTYFSRIACNSINKREVVHTFAIEIHKDANKERYQFDQTDYEDWKQLTFDRLKANDITHIEFELEESYVEDGETSIKEQYNYAINYSEDENLFYENKSQKSYISKDGNFYIVVSEDKNIEDFFNKEWIDDSSGMDFHFEMMDVGDANQNN